MLKAITGQAFSKSQIIDKLEDNSFEFLVQLAKLWIFPQASEVNHWRHEVWSFYRRINRIKPGNKLPKPQFIEEHILGLYINSKMHSVLQMAVDKEYELAPDFAKLEDVNRFRKYASEYVFWLAEYLSENEVVSSKLVADKLQEFGF